MKKEKESKTGKLRKELINEVEKATNLNQVKILLIRMLRGV